MKPRATIPHPSAPTWAENFRAATVRVGFVLSLSRAQLEFLCATADGVMWDRHVYRAVSVPDNWLASERALVKRGLIARIPEAEFDAKKYDDHGPGEFTCTRLTPAGEAVVSLLKLAGLFVEADAAINRKARGRAAR